MTIDRSDDIIDTRDIIETLQELADLIEYRDEAETDDERSEYQEQIDDWHDSYPGLVEFAKECEDVADDYPHGATVIADSYLETYAKELAEDLYDIPDTWPHRCIDWEEAADQLKEDYTEVSWSGELFWIR